MGPVTIFTERSSDRKRETIQVHSTVFRNAFLLENIKDQKRKWRGALAEGTKWCPNTCYLKGERARRGECACVFEEGLSPGECLQTMFQDALARSMKRKKATNSCFSLLVLPFRSQILGWHCWKGVGVKWTSPSKLYDSGSYSPTVNFLRKRYFSPLVHLIQMYWKPETCHNLSFWQGTAIKATVLNNC